MDSKERKLIIVLLSVSFLMMLAGCFFVPFMIHVWTYLANLAGDKDAFLAATLVAYFVMFALFGVALGLWINAYLVCVVKAIFSRTRKTSDSSNDAMRK